MGLSAALTYYALTSITPLLVLMVAIAGLILNPTIIEETVVSFFQSEIGDDTAIFIGELVERALDRRASVTASLLSTLVLLFSASGLFRHVQRNLNMFLGSEPAEPLKIPIQGKLARKIIDYLIRETIMRVKAFLVLLVIGFLVIAGMFISSGAALLAIQRRFESAPSLTPLRLGNSIFSFLLIWGLYYIIFRVVPRVQLSRMHTLAGAFLGSIIFAALQAGISAYLSTAGVGSIYGAAGSLVVLLFWVYYSVQSLFFGAAYARVLDEKKSGRENN